MNLAAMILQGVAGGYGVGRLYMSACEVLVSRVVKASICQWAVTAAGRREDQRVVQNYFCWRF